MRRPAVFFDRDNTLIIGNDYLGDPAGVVLVAGAPAAVALCRELGYAVVVVSNQSGVARGMFTEEAVAAVNQAMNDQLLAANPAAVIDRHEYCPHHPQGTAAGYAVECDCRKPLPGMVFRAADAMALDLAASWMVGDAPRDIVAGHAAGCRTILIIDKTLPPSPAAKEAVDVPADFVVGSLVEAVDVIVQEANRRSSADVMSGGSIVQRSEAAEPVHGSTFDDAMPGSLHDVAEANLISTSPTTAEPIAPASRSALIAAPARTVEPASPAPVARPAAAPSAIDPPSPPAETTSRSFIDESEPLIAPRRPLASATPIGSAPAASPAAPATKTDVSRLEMTSQQILMELKKFNDIRHDDFSISKLIAGITQTLALAALPLAYVLYRTDAGVLHAWLLTAIFLQMFTIALLLMGRQR